jgi:hypothetical protein
LGLSPKELTSLSSRANEMFYITKVITKPDGSKRETYDVKPELKRIHERIKTKFFKAVNYPSFLHGSLKGKDYLSNIKEHTHKKVIISEDVSNFFPSLSKKVIHEVWVGVFGFSNDVSNILSELVTHNGFLVQGAKPSSFLSNLVLWNREAELVLYFKERGYTYTRYVDDITVSSERNLSKKEMSEIIKKVYLLLHTVGVKPNRKKHHVMPDGRRQNVHRINVNSGSPSLPKAERAKIKSAVFECEKKHEKLANTSQYVKLYNQTMGRVNNMKRMHPKEGAELRFRLSTVKPS